MTEPVLEIRDLSVRFATHQGIVRAVQHVSLSLEREETLGLVGESGSGKSVTSLAVMGLVPTPPGVVEGGQVRFGGHDLLALSDEELRRLRGAEIAMIFQDPMTSLNPLLTVGLQLSEVLEVHRGMTRREARRRAAAALGDVGIPRPEEQLDRHPHHLSGGMRQRVMIAMALLCDPKVLIADEPTTALDVTIQAQILELLTDLQRRHGTAVLLITHDLGVVAGRADRVHVMYAGRIIERACTRDLFARPAHPYTRGLLASVPRITSSERRPLASIEGQPPDLAHLPPGCAFAPRCERARAECLARVPAQVDPGDRHARGPRAAACIDAAALIAAQPEGGAS